MWTIIGYIIVGLIGGAIAKLILPGRQGGGIVLTMLLGIIGALLGGFLGGLIFHVSYGDIWSWAGLICSIIGSIIILLIFGLVRGRGRRTV